MNVFGSLQGLTVEAKATIVVAILVALVPWGISEFRQSRRHRGEQTRQDERDLEARVHQAERDRNEQGWRERQEQVDLIAKQAAFAFARFPDENPIGVGGWGEDRMLLGELHSVGMAGATRVNMRAFLNHKELPHLGSWPSEQPMPVGAQLRYRFLLPFKVEPPGRQEGPWLDEELGNSLVRFDVRFNDASSADRVLSYCFRFDLASPPSRWQSRQVDC